MRIRIPLLLLLAAAMTMAMDSLPAQDQVTPSAPPRSGAPSGPSEAASIAADIIKQRALELAGAGDTTTASRLEDLAHGLLQGRISLGDAALVMQIAGAAHPAQSPAASPLTPEATAATHSAESLLDGDAPSAGHAAPGAAQPPGGAAAAAPNPSPADAAAAGTAPGTANANAKPADAPPLALPSMPPKPDPVISGKVYAVDDGVEGKVVSAAIGVGSSTAGVAVGSHFIIKRGQLTIAKATVFKLSPTLSYAAIDQGSLVDPRNDVKEGDLGVLQP